MLSSPRLFAAATLWRRSSCSPSSTPPTRPPVRPSASPVHPRRSRPRPRRASRSRARPRADPVAEPPGRRGALGSRARRRSPSAGWPTASTPSAPASCWSGASATTSFTWRVDTAAPAVPAVSGGSLDWLAVATRTVNHGVALDPSPASGVAAYSSRISTDGGATWAAGPAGAVDVTAEGETLVEYAAVDRAGNASPWSAPAVVRRTDRADSAQRERELRVDERRRGAGHGRPGRDRRAVRHRSGRL